MEHRMHRTENNSRLGKEGMKMALNYGRENAIAKVMEHNVMLGKLLLYPDKHNDEYDACYVRGLTRALYELGIIDYMDREILIGACITVVDEKEG